MKWISPKTITGPPAEGSKYLRRQYINDEFWTRIENGEHIIISAPRRVGKSSIMKDLEKNCPTGIIAIYNNIESDKTKDEFYKRLFTLLIEKTSTQKKITTRINRWLKTNRIGEISPEGNVKIEKTDLNHKEELLNLIQELGKESIRVVMLLDEFPEVIVSIKNSEGPDVAIDVLHTLRGIRHNEKFENFSMVFAGSIGIEHVIAELDRLKLINDLYPLKIEPLNDIEANQLIEQLLTGATMVIGDIEKKYLLKKITYLLPYFIQLMIDKCNSILNKESRPELSNADIDKAFEIIIIEGRNFEDWESRLNKYLKNKEAKYCIEIITRCAHYNQYSLQEAYDLSIKTKPESNYKHLLDDVLLKDGYLFEKQNNYYFISPFLKEWWKNRHPEIELKK